MSANVLPPPVTEPSGAGRGLAPWLAEGRAMVGLAVPILLTNLSQQAMQMTDVIMIGRLGPTELAASVIGVSWFYLFFVFGFGVVNAAGGIMAQDLGRKLHSVRAVRRTVRQSLWAVLLMAALFFPALWFPEPIFLALGQDPQLVPMAMEYLRALMWCFIPLMGFMVLRGFTAALERPGPAMLVSMLAIGFNVLANYALIFGNFEFPALGLTGAGLATVCSNILLFTGITIVVLVDRQFRRFAVFGRFWRADWSAMRELFRVGLPAGATFTLEVGFFIAAAFVVGLFGAPQLAAHQIALQIPSTTFMVPLGLAMAATVRVGLAQGAGNPEGVRVAGWTAIALGSGFMAVVAVPMLLFPEQLAWLFLDPADDGTAAVIAHATIFLTIAAMFQVVDGAQAIGQGVLRGLKDTLVPMIIAVVGYWIIGAAVALGLAFGLGLEAEGIWYGFVAGLGVVAVLVVARFAFRRELGLMARAGQDSDAHVT